MITSKTAQTADTANWVHGCFMVQVGSDFTTYQDIMEYALAGEYEGNTSTTPQLEKHTAAALKSVAPGPDSTGKDYAMPYYFSKRKCRDSSLGGNDAINPLPQFGIDDDITHTHYQSNYGGKTVGQMGQVYSESYDTNQQILYLGFGIPVFSNVGNFWSKAVDMDMADFVNKGSGITSEKIGYLVGSAPIRAVKIATIPFKFIKGLVDGLQNVPITKYYSFASQMPMYFRFVNSILVHLATNMNMMGSADDVNLTGSNSSDATLRDLNQQGRRTGQDTTGMGTVFSKFGLDMAQIMTKRYLYENGDNTALRQRNTDDAMFDAANDKVNGSGIAEPPDPNQSSNPSANASNSGAAANDVAVDAAAAAATEVSKSWKLGWVDAFKAAYGGAIYDGHLFIGFRIDKGMGASESFSNATGESHIAQIANAKFTEGREAAFGTMSGKFGSGAVGSIASAAAEAVSGVLKGVSNMINLDPLAAALSGSAKIDIPEVWTGSNYSRSASFSLTLLTPYGDPESIFQSLYVPLACMLAGTLPRGTGYASHSSPFICQAYCRGVFSSPLCMIESLEVSRGSDQYGWTASRHPLKIGLHVTLKDLSPSMYMSMAGDQGIGKAIFGTDDNFGEYMLTLSGMGLRDRLSPFRSIRRKTEILLSTLYKNKLSPYMLGMEGGSRFFVSRLISKVVSGGRGLPSN